MMCWCTPEMRTPFCGRPGCRPPEQGDKKRDKKQRIFVTYSEGVDANLILGDVDRALEYFKTYLVELQDGEEVTFEIRRKDMTEAELEAAPVI